MRTAVLLLLVLCVLAVAQPAGHAGITRHDIVVVYNSSSAWNTPREQGGWGMSKAVADYYCDVHGIPVESHEVGVAWPYGSESIDPSNFVTYIERPFATSSNPTSTPTRMIRGAIPSR